MRNNCVRAFLPNDIRGGALSGARGLLLAEKRRCHNMSDVPGTSAAAPCKRKHSEISTHMTCLHRNGHAYIHAGRELPRQSESPSQQLSPFGQKFQKDQNDNGRTGRVSGTLLPRTLQRFPYIRVPDIRFWFISRPATTALFLLSLSAGRPGLLPHVHPETAFVASVQTLQKLLRGVAGHGQTLTGLVGADRLSRVRPDHPV